MLDPDAGGVVIVLLLLLLLAVVSEMPGLKDAPPGLNDCPPAPAPAPTLAGVEVGDGGLMVTGLVYPVGDQPMVTGTVPKETGAPWEMGVSGIPVPRVPVPADDGLELSEESSPESSGVVEFDDGGLLPDDESGVDVDGEGVGVELSSELSVAVEPLPLLSVAVEPEESVGDPFDGCKGFVKTEDDESLSVADGEELSVAVTEEFNAKHVEGVAVTVTVVAEAAPHPGGVGKPLSVQPGDEGVTLNLSLCA